MSQIGSKVIIVTKFSNIKESFIFCFCFLATLCFEFFSSFVSCVVRRQLCSHNVRYLSNIIQRSSGENKFCIAQVAQRQQEGKETHSNHSEFPPQTQSHLALVHICAGLWGSSGQWWQVGRPAPEPVGCCTSGESQVHSPAWCQLKLQHRTCELNEGMS